MRPLLASIAIRKDLDGETSYRKLFITVSVIDDIAVKSFIPFTKNMINFL
ncbi:MAG: hypothetical protein JWQ23_3509 [Herminiimonas sp.]|nr:hypothetical protein [Herminiimonas sp.]